MNASALVRLLLLGAIAVYVASCGSSFSEAQFGGPYAIRPDKIDDKVDEFEVAKKIKLYFSEANKLSLEVLKGGLEKNRETPDGKKNQRYNYVISLQGDILIAVWKSGAKDSLGNIPLKECKGGSDLGLDAWNFEGMIVSIRKKPPEANEALVGLTLGRRRKGSWTS
jgi:hypothetical protein